MFFADNDDESADAFDRDGAANANAEGEIVPAKKNRERFAIKKSYSIEVNLLFFLDLECSGNKALSVSSFSIDLYINC